ncbi:Kinesin-related motor protein, partial [Elasticomyces elasticus]
MSGDMTESCGLLTDAAGIIPRVLQSLFQKLEAEEAECSVKCSFIELYNEELRDLLATDESVKLKIFDDANKKSHSATLVQGMEESHVTSAAAGIQLLQKGSLRRQVAATKCNDLSSRSHTVFTITTCVKKVVRTFRGVVLRTKELQKPVLSISLLTLGRVINALVDKSSHIPYRESKLTRLLQDSLGGRTKTCIIATVSPARSNLEETISTLDYAFRAKNIRNKPQINSMISKKTLLREFTAEIEKLKSELIATRQRNGVYMTNEQFEEMTIQSESRRILSEEQKARIEAMEVSLRNKVQELFSLTNTFTTLKKDNEQTRVNFEGTQDVLQKTEIVLADTKRTLHEESQLRQKYATNEDRLHAVGRNLISTIDSSLQDVNDLHTKLRRRSALHHQNQHSWQDMQTRGRIMITDIDSNLENLKDEHSVALTFASKRLQVFVGRESNRTAQAQKLVEDGLATLENAMQTTTAQTSGARDQMNDVLEEIKVLRDDVKTKVGQGLNGLSDAAARISGEVISELDSFHTQLHASYAGLGKEFKAIFDDLTKQLASQREESDRLRKALQEANHASIQAQLNTATHLENAIEAERQSAELDKQELMAKMTELILRSSASRQTRLDTMLTDAQTGIVDATEALDSADKVYDTGMNEWQDQDSSLQARMIKSRDDMKARMKRDWSAVNARNTANQQSTKAVHQETVKIVDAQVSDMDTQMAALNEFVTRARQQNEAHVSEHVAALDAASNTIKESFETISEHVQSEHINGFSQDMSANLSGLGAISAGLAAQVQRPLQAFQHEISDHDMIDYQQTGQTPQKRDWQYTRDLPRTIPLPESTTPKTQAPVVNGRTPARSPRKFASPRKSPKKQMVRVDTPPTLFMPQPLAPTQKIDTVKVL